MSRRRSVKGEKQEGTLTPLVMRDLGRRVGVRRVWAVTLSMRQADRSSFLPVDPNRLFGNPPVTLRAGRQGQRAHSARSSRAPALEPGRRRNDSKHIHEILVQGFSEFPNGFQRPYNLHRHHDRAQAANGKVWVCADLLAALSPSVLCERMGLGTNTIAEHLLEV